MTDQASATAQDGMNTNTAQLDVYLDSIARDRQAIDAMAADLLAVGESGSVVSADSSAAGAVSLAQTMEELAGPISDTKDRYLDVLMESCSSLPALVVSEIKTEVAGLLDAKMKGKLGDLKKSLETIPSASAIAAPISVENPSHEQLVSGLAHLVSLPLGDAARTEANKKFALSMIKSGDVRQEIEPMVALLVTYAQARLNENETAQ